MTDQLPATSSQAHDGSQTHSGMTDLELTILAIWNGFPDTTDPRVKATTLAMWTATLEGVKPSELNTAFNAYCRERRDVDRKGYLRRPVAEDLREIVRKARAEKVRNELARLPRPPEPPREPPCDPEVARRILAEKGYTDDFVEQVARSRKVTSRRQVEAQIHQVTVELPAHWRGKEHTRGFAALQELRVAQGLAPYATSQNEETD